jgi:glycosyltransferase involved in cell wall biosynthesis
LAASSPAAPASASAPAVVYIAGSGRSGSTLVERTIGALPGYVNVGELIDLCRRVVPNNELCGCGRPFDQCPYWRAVGQRGFGGWGDAPLREMHALQVAVARQRHLPRLLAPPRSGRGFGRGFGAALSRYAELYLRLYQVIAEEASAQVVVDASKWPAQAVALARGGVDLRVIHLVRDPRGVAHSLARPDIQRPHAVDKTDLMASSSPLETALRWTATQSEIELLRLLGVPLTVLRYEDFVRAPAESISSALRALQLPGGGPELAHIDGDSIVLGVSHGLSGNPSRFIQGRIELRRDDRWHTEMRLRDRVAVTAVTAPALGWLHRQRRSSDGEATSAGAGSGLGGPADWPPVSVLLATRGRPELVRESIASIVDQTYPGDLECLVIHDQEPTDPTLESLGRPRRRVSVIASRSAGLAGARNTGLDASSAEIVATCDDDDTWHPRKLELQVRRLLEQPELLVVGSGIRLVLPKGKLAEWPGRADEIGLDLLLRNRVKELHSSTLVMRRDAFAKAGRYDEGLPRGYAEDYDWVLRAARVGRIGVVREPLADIRKDGQSYYAGRSENTVIALEHFLAKHPEIAASRRGHARILGQLAYNQAVLHRRRAALATILRALRRWPFSPHVYLALAQLLTGAHPDQVRRVVRLFGRGMA